VISNRPRHNLTVHLLLTLVYFSLVACQQARRKNAPPASSSSTTDTAAPKLKLAQPKFEMGPMVQDEPVKRTTPVSNVGSLPPLISKIDSSRFCSGNMEPKTLAPGASATLDITCRSDLYGPMNEAMVIQTNDPKAPKMTIRMVASVTPLLAFDAPTVHSEMFFGEERTAEVHLVGTLLDKARIKLKAPAIADVEILPLPPKTEKIRSFRIHCKGRKVGANVGNLIITT
jgi:hypothetical protein